MSTIELYCMPESPPCRLVELVADKLGLRLAKKYLNVAEGEHLSKQFLEINPLHIVPTIVDGDTVLWESRAIICYLVNKYATNGETRSLYPGEAVLRAKVDMMLYFDMGILYKAQSDLFRPKLRGSNELDANCEIKFREALDYLESILSTADYVTGDQLTVADISIVCGLTFSEACDYDLTQYKHITLYRERVKRDLPTYDAVNVEPIARFRAYVLSRGLSLLGSATYWKSLLTDDVRHKRPCLDHSSTNDNDRTKHPHREPELPETGHTDTSSSRELPIRASFKHSARKGCDDSDGAPAAPASKPTTAT